MTDKVNAASEHISYTAYARSYLLPFARIQSWQTDIADQVIALGYPLGIRSVRNNYPVAKMGYLASIPGQEVSIPFPTINRAGTNVEVVVDGKFLVVDGLIVNGNSGGPVVLVGRVRVRRDPATNQLQFTDKPIENYVIGVVLGGLGPSGLTVVISSDYLLEMLRAGNPACRIVLILARQDCGDFCGDCSRIPASRATTPSISIQATELTVQKGVAGFSAVRPTT